MAAASGGALALFPVLLGRGCDEMALAQQVIANLAGGPVLNLASRITLRNLMAIFSECATAFRPDLGTMYPEAAAGCSVVSLWDSTSLDCCTLCGLADLALAGQIPRHPCYLRECPVRYECMRRRSPLEFSAATRCAITETGVIGTFAADAHDAPVASSVLDSAASLRRARGEGS
jgi:hypothetical protein